jgi:hypothetical protein
MSDNPLHSVEDILPHKGTKIGKHSVWLYGALLGGAILVFFWYERSRGTAPADTTTTDGSLPEVSGEALGSSSGEAGGVSDSAGGSDNPGTTNIYYTQSGTVADVTPIKTLSTGGVRTTAKTNNSWEKDAVAFLTAAGIGGQNATRAITKYLNGDRLTYHQHVMVNQAIKNVGLNPKKTDKTSTFETKAQAVRKAKHEAKVRTEKKAAKAAHVIKASKPKKTIQVKKKAKKR